MKRNAKESFKAELSRTPLLNRQAAAKTFGVSVSLLEKLASRGSGPRYYRVVQSKRAAAAYRIEDLESFFASRAGRGVQSCNQLRDLGIATSPSEKESNHQGLAK